MENGHLYPFIDGLPNLNMVIFYSYVKLPEGISIESRGSLSTKDSKNSLTAGSYIIQAPASPRGRTRTDDATNHT